MKEQQSLKGITRTSASAEDGVVTQVSCALVCWCCIGSGFLD